MSSYAQVFAKIFPVLFLIFLGFIFQKIRFFDERIIGGIKKLIINATLPCLLFTAFLQTSFQPNYLVIVISVLLTCIVMVLIGKAAGRLIGIESPYFPLALGGFETGMVGYSIFGAVYGTNSVGIMGIVDLGQEIFVFMILLSILLRLKNGSKGVKDTLKSFILCPVIIAIALGIAAGNTGFINIFKSNPLLGSILQTVNLISAPTIPLICIVIGYEMRLDFKTILNPLKTIVVRMTLLIGLGLLINEFVINRILHLDRIFQAALMVMFILPPPFIIPLYLKDEDIENKRYILNTLPLNTLITLAAFFIISGFYM